ncbi:hypothetical protein QE417_002135 [Mucilaginibacter terrae]|uniref:Uncharacterized protein n=1 Tax=Mucilaginibacter terrae TaxID=1955052 RepID=A0ABU3GTF6_9SPHI|nr:hypothetical protein [Mucilaginibacter terrae]
MSRNAATDELYFVTLNIHSKNYSRSLKVTPWKAVKNGY